MFTLADQVMNKKKLPQLIIIDVKMRGAFVQKNNKKVLLRQEATIFVARSELRGKILFFFKNCKNNENTTR